MFQHGSLSPNFERFPFSVFNFSYLIFSYLIHLILSCLALSCLVLHFNALYCIAFSPSLRREKATTGNTSALRRLCIVLYNIAL